MKLLETIFRYWFRFITVAFLVWFTVFATSRIGVVASSEPLTWEGAWLIALKMALLLSLAFLAGRESKGGAK